MHPAVEQSALARRKSGMLPFVLASLAGHAAVVGGVALFGLINRPPPIDLDQKPITASLVRLGKPRDQKLLPRKEEPPPPPAKVEQSPPAPGPQAKPEPAAVAVPIPGVKPKPPPAAQKQEGSKDSDRRSALFGAFSKVGKAAKPEPLEGREDGDPSGDSAVAEGEQYWGLIKAHVHRNYNVTEAIPDTERLHLKARVRLWIGKAGELTKLELVKASGNSLFDTAVLTAAKKTAPFSPPPGSLREKLQREGVTLEFTP
ncbi:MAG TPA: TonB family protein [Myxococcaceae bacterium]|nr:TonB family protein [Myxococcaceae bacterium]